MISELTLPGLIYEYTNTGAAPRNVRYASITAPGVVRCEVSVNSEVIEIVFAGQGGSHSWWQQAGGPLLPPDRFPNGLPPNSTLQIWSSGPAALRVDWYDV
jgi:hypothetical protein